MANPYALKCDANERTVEDDIFKGGVKGIIYESSPLSKIDPYIITATRESLSMRKRTTWATIRLLNGTQHTISLANILENKRAHPSDIKNALNLCNEEALAENKKRSKTKSLTFRNNFINQIFSLLSCLLMFS